MAVASRHIGCVQDHLDAGAPLQRPARAKMDLMTTLERLDLMARHRPARTQEEQKRDSAIRAFDGQLDATQRTAFDQNFRPGRGHGPHGDSHRGGQRGDHGQGPWGGGYL